MTREEAIKQVKVALERLKSNFSKTAWWAGTGEAFETLIPELKPDDETTRNEILAYIGSKTDIDLETHNRWCSYLEKQKEQKPAEWSEEDETIIEGACSALEIHGHDKLASKLKSLRPSWKPSEEHLSALLAIFNDPDNIGSQTCQLALTDLYEQLKKL